MAVLNILATPDPRLRIPAKPVECVDDSVRQLMRDLLETMYHDDGIGLAATQVGDSRRVIVIDVSDRESSSHRPYLMANPEVIHRSNDMQKSQEGCLSVPGHYGTVDRAATVTVKYLDEDNTPQEIKVSELFAACVQHEIDHLNGVLFIDHLSTLKRNMILKKVAKERKRDAEIL